MPSLFAAPFGNWARATVGAGLLVMLAILGGCENRDGPDMIPRPTGYHPGRFPDIRLPPDYVLWPDHDQLAVTLAGGAVRRFDVSLITKLKTKPESPDEALDYFVRTLPATGWQVVAEPKSTRAKRWRKTTQAGDSEELHVATDTSGTRTTIHLRLVPAG